MFSKTCHSCHPPTPGTSSKINKERLMTNRSTVRNIIGDLPELIAYLSQEIREGMPDRDAAALAACYKVELDSRMAGWSRERRRSHRYTKARRKLVKIIARVGIAPAVPPENMTVGTCTAFNPHHPEDTVAFFDKLSKSDAKVIIIPVEDDCEFT